MSDYIEFGEEARAVYSKLEKENNPKMVQGLVKTGLVKTSESATLILVGIASISIIASIFIFALGGTHYVEDDTPIEDDPRLINT